MNNKSNLNLNIFWKSIITTTLILLIIISVSGFSNYQSLSNSITKNIDKIHVLNKRYNVLKNNIAHSREIEKSQIKTLEKTIISLSEYNTQKSIEMEWLENELITAKKNSDRICYIFLRSLEYSEDTAITIANKMTINPTIEYYNTVIENAPKDVEDMQLALELATIIAEINATNNRIDYLDEHQYDVINQFIKEHSTWLTGLVLKVDH